MEKEKLIFNSNDKRKRKRDQNKKNRKMKKIEEKILQQEEFTNQLRSEVHSIFKHLTTIQEHLVFEDRVRSAHASSTPPTRSPVRKPFPLRLQQDSIYTVTSNEVFSDEDEEGKMRTWESPKNLISLFHSQIQPKIPAYSLWSQVEGVTGVTGMESSLQSTVTRNTHTSHYSTALQSRFSIDSGTSGGGTGGGGGGGGGGGVGGEPRSHFHTMPTPGGGGGAGGGGGGGGGPMQRDSPCDCTVAREFCKCKGETAGLKPQSQGVAPLQQSSRVSPSSSREGAKPLTNSEKAMCTCKGSGRIRRECPLKAKRRLKAAARATNIHSPAGPQQFTDEELEKAFDEEPEEDVQLGENEQVFMDVFPELNTDLSHHHEWPMPHTPMQDFSNMSHSMFAEPFSFSESELAKAFDEEEIEDVSLSENECVFMDQFPDLTEPTRHPRGADGQGMLAPGSIRPVPSSSSASSALQGAVPRPVSNKTQDGGQGMSAPGSVKPVPSSSSACSALRGAVLRPKTQDGGQGTSAPGSVPGEVPQSATQQPPTSSQDERPISTPTQECTDRPLPDCHCTPCAASGSNADRPVTPSGFSQVPGVYVSQPSGQVATPIGYQSAPPMPSEPAVQLEELSSECSCNPCPSYDGDDANGPQPKDSSLGTPSPRQASQRPSQSSKEKSPPISAHASTQTCPDQFGQPYIQCTCEPTCEDLRKAKGIIGSKPQIQGQGSIQQVGKNVVGKEQIGGDPGSRQEVEKRTLAPPGTVKASSSLHVDQPDLSSGEPQAWSDKDLEHAFSQEDIPYVELAENEALFMDQFPEAAGIPYFIRMPQPLPFTPMQDFSSTPQDQFTYPQEFSDEELATAFDQEDVPDVQISEDERNFMKEFPGISGGPDGGMSVHSGQTPAKQIPPAGDKICRCPKRVRHPCICKQRRKQGN